MEVGRREGCIGVMVLGVFECEDGGGGGGLGVSDLAVFPSWVWSG